MKRDWQHLITPNSVTLAALALVLASALIAPRVVYRLLHDGGFEHWGHAIDLAEWPHMRTFRNHEAPLHTDAVNVENGVRHRDFWVNTGQWLRFRNVPATTYSRLTCLVRVHPLWGAGGTAHFRLLARAKDGTVISSDVDFTADAQAPWREASLDLSPLAGREVDITIMPLSDAPGMWTLLRDPRIAIVDPR